MLFSFNSFSLSAQFNLSRAGWKSKTEIKIIQYQVGVSVDRASRSPKKATANSKRRWRRVNNLKFVVKNRAEVVSWRSRVKVIITAKANLYRRPTIPPTSGNSDIASESLWSRKLREIRSKTKMLWFDFWSQLFFPSSLCVASSYSRTGSVLSYSFFIFDLRKLLINIRLKKSVLFTLKDITEKNSSPSNELVSFSSSWELHTCWSEKSSADEEEEKSVGLISSS